ncbi:hypothetical protein [Cellulomonas sp. PhB143]|uniref:hypothetical protein n=1 Tax=Cellulomonas sp. PhB143 TaxID=2485186 RepID=UPI000FB189AB|nr:hypothetical protein [Cellulomonas sp. PhB143]ROS77234.1 hypothetical protein EDF32_1232 [Cellulomonas sp. PhB143]
MSTDRPGPDDPFDGVDFDVPDDLSSLLDQPAAQGGERTEPAEVAEPAEAAQPAENAGAAEAGEATTSAGAGSPAPAAEDPDAEADGDDLQVPDDLSQLAGSPDADPELAVVMTQIAGAEPLAAVCAVAKVAGVVVPTKVGAFVVLEVRAGGAPQEAVSALSRLVAGVPFVLVEKRAEQISARRWQDGLPEDELAPGLVLGGAPEALEDVVVGEAQASALEGAVATSSISRFKAARMLSAAARKARKK